MRKLLTLMMILTMALSLAACGSSKATDSVQADQAPETAQEAEAEVTEPTGEAVVEEPETIVIKSFNGEKELVDLEVPYNPERIAVIDMPALDILDALGLGDRIVGSAKVTIEYLTQYNPDDSAGKILNLGSVKTADLEQVAISAPEVIFIGGRLAASYDALSEIAPVVYLGVDYEKGILQSTADNAKIIASMFGKEAEIDAMMEGFQARIDALKEVVNGKEVLLGMYNNNAMSLMATQSQLNLIANEMGAVNLGESVGETEKPAHGDDASWETIISLNPEYLFVLDRSTATEAAEEGILGAAEVIENDLIKELDVYKDGKIVYFIEHANVWYTATGGIQAMDTMLSDLEGALLK